MKQPALSDHAVIRFMERLRQVEIDPDDRDSINEGRHYLANVLPHGRWEQRAPLWAGRLRGRERDRYFVLGDDICFIVAGGCAVTCVVKGSISTQSRQRRNSHRSARRYGRRKRGGQ